MLEFLIGGLTVAVIYTLFPAIGEGITAVVRRTWRWMSGK